VYSGPDRRSKGSIPNHGDMIRLLQTAWSRSFGRFVVIQPGGREVIPVVGFLVRAKRPLSRTEGSRKMKRRYCLSVTDLSGDAGKMSNVQNAWLLYLKLGPQKERTQAKVVRY
jgi:hypothetical protein